MLIDNNAASLKNNSKKPTFSTKNTEDVTRRG